MRAFSLAAAKLTATAIAVAMWAGGAAAAETPKPAAAQTFLGAAVTGPNYKVKPTVRSDGIMRIFDVDTNYGAFQFNGVDFTKMRLQELKAVAALEKMSQSNEFMNAFGRAAIAPVQFGANLITNPGDTISRSLSGVANMFDRAGAGLSNTGSDRDSLLDSLLGVSDTQRQLAVELGVDPYSDFPPLAERLKQMAGAMAGGSLPVKAGLALIPGGAGVAISSVSSIDQAKDTLRDKTAAQVLQEVRVTLQSLEVPDENINRLVGNRNYTPADLLIMTRALGKIHAQNTEAFVDNSAQASTRDAAYYQRRRAELLAARGGELGGIEAFFIVKGQALTFSPGRTVAAAFPFDDFAWAEIPQRSFTAATADLRTGDTAGVPLVFATSGLVTPMAAAELRKLGWKVVKLKPIR